MLETIRNICWGIVEMSILLLSFFFILLTFLNYFEDGSVGILYFVIFPWPFFGCFLKEWWLLFSGYLLHTWIECWGGIAFLMVQLLPRLTFLTCRICFHSYWVSVMAMRIGYLGKLLNKSNEPREDSKWAIEASFFLLFMKLMLTSLFFK